MAGAALSAAPRQLRRGPPGPAARAWVDSVIADGGAGGRAAASGAASRGTGLRAVRNTSGPAAADRLWWDDDIDRRGAGAGARICRDTGLLAASVCPGLPA